MGSDIILVGKFGAPHGVRGEMRLKSYTSTPLDIAVYRPLIGRDGQPYELKAARVIKDDMLVVRVVGIETREAAAVLTHVDLYVARETLPPAASDEFYHADLVGLRAVHAKSGTPLGIVSAVQDHGGGAILEVAPGGGGDTLLFPFTLAIVPRIDVAEGVVTILPPHEVDGERER